MTEKPQRIIVENTARGWILAGSILLGAAIAFAAYGLQLQGLGEVAATGATFFAFTFIKSIGSSVWGATHGGYFSRVGELVRVLADDYSSWIAARPVPAKASIALALTVVFMIVRWLMSTVLSLITNWWIAGALACVVAAVIAAPSIFTFLGRTIQSEQDRPSVEPANDGDQA